MTDQIGQPAYQKIADDLRRRIQSGDLVVGDAIPSTTQLCSQYEVSITVVRAAIGQLRSAGLLRGQPGKAVYVISTPDAIAAETSNLNQLAAQIQELRLQVAEPVTPESHNDEVRDELRQLRRQVARLQTQLIELYGKTGHAYPREQSEATSTPSRRTAG